MNRYRSGPPRLGHELFLTDGGIETTLIFHEGIDLPHFAAFDLLRHAEGREALVRYYRQYMRLAERLGMGIVLESATWRANPDWGKLLGYGASDLSAANVAAIQMLKELRDELTDAAGPAVISGCVGPRGDGYVVGATMTVVEATRYHTDQIGAFEQSEADMVTAITMTYVEEAIGVARAADAIGMPVVISFTVETDGRLPSGTPLGEAIASVDGATDGAPVYYMINCAHPTHFDHALHADAGWLERIGAFERRLPTKPRGARRGSRPRRGRPRGARRRIRGPLEEASEALRARRLLRDGPPPRGCHRRVVSGRGPEGDTPHLAQSGLESGAGWFVTFRDPSPSACTVKISPTPEIRLVNAIRDPSRDHDGAKSDWSVSRITFPPSRSATKRASSPWKRWLVNAMLRPSGDQAGSPSSEGWFVMLTGFDPSARIT